MIRLMLLLGIVSMMILASCGKNDDLIVKDDDKIVEEDNRNYGKYEAKRLDSVSTYIVKMVRTNPHNPYDFKVGDTVDVNIYDNIIRSKSQWTRRMVITKLL